MAHLHHRRCLKNGTWAFLTACLINAGISQLNAFEVFLNTNSPADVSRGSQFFNRNDWKDTAKTIDGIWYVGQGMTKPPEGETITKARLNWVKSLQDKHWIVEVQGRVMAAMGEGTHSTVHEVKIIKDAQISDFHMMVFREDRNKDSTLTAEDVEATRKGLKAAGVPDTPIIVNTRGFHRNKLAKDLLDKHVVGGLSFEMASKHIREGKILESDVAPAIEFAVRQKEYLYLLINAEHTKDYLGDVQDISKRLFRAIPREMATPYVRLVLSSYSGKGAIEFTPERNAQGNYANTTTGTALWLCAEADKAKLRSVRP